MSIAKRFSPAPSRRNPARFISFRRSEQAAAAPAKPVPAQLTDVVARVNGEDVKKVDLERMIHTMEGRAGQPVPPDHRDEIYRSALDQLIVYTLLSQEGKNRGIKIDDAEIDAKMKQLRDQFPTQDAFDKALKERGMTADSVRKDARVDLSVNKVMDAERTLQRHHHHAVRVPHYPGQRSQGRAHDPIRGSAAADQAVSRAAEEAGTGRGVYRGVEEKVADRGPDLNEQVLPAAAAALE